MPTEAGRNYPLSSARLLGILHQEKAFSHFFPSSCLAFSSYIIAMCSDVTMGKGPVRRGIHKLISAVFLQVFRLFLLTCVRFFWFPLSFGASCRLGWQLMSCAVHHPGPAGREKPHEPEQSSSHPLWSCGVAFNLVFLAAPLLFSVSVQSRL